MVRFLLATAIACTLLPANVRLPAVLADHMVIQRDRPVHLWGRSSPGETVSVEFHGNSATVVASAIGTWGVYLPPVKAGGPFEITIKGENSITLADVLVGDLWVASGQSNMEFPLSGAVNGAEEVASATYPAMRLFHVEHRVASYPLDDVEAHGWQPCTRESAAEFSAVAYFFGRKLRQDLNVPIGLIETNWGGTVAEAWTSLRALSSDASLMPVFREWSRLSDDTVTQKLYREQQLRKWQEAVDRAKAEGRTPPDRPWKGNVDSGEWEPAGLYNGMIAPLTPLPIRGVIWYQGESNAGPERYQTYARLFQTMIQDWRRAWGEEDFPFLFVQLAGYKTGEGSKWPELRDAQRQALELKNTGMAVAIDIGNPTDIHPKDKQDVGLRLALAAQAISYGEHVEYSGPMFREAAPEGASIRVWFNHAGAGLETRNGELETFEVAGRDQHFVPAQARIDGDTVVASAATVPKPVYVRYGWCDYCACNLYNKDGLPASPFQSVTQ